MEKAKKEADAMETIANAYSDFRGKERESENGTTGPDSGLTTQ